MTQPQKKLWWKWIKIQLGAINKLQREKHLFFLSGGITANDVQEINNLDIPQLYAIDINSKFETEPGMKRHRISKKK